MSTQDQLDREATVFAALVGHGDHGSALLSRQTPDGVPSVLCACAMLLGLPDKDQADEIDRILATRESQSTVEDYLGKREADALAAELDDTVGSDFEAAREQENVLVNEGMRILNDAAAGSPIRPGVALLDPTKPYGPKEVEEHILDVNARLERGIEYEAALITVRDSLEMEYNLANARALSEAKASDAAGRKAEAMLACEAQYRAMVHAKRVWGAMAATTHSLRSVLTAYQSVAKSVAAAYNQTNRNQDYAQHRAERGY
jgi:hypothetical protein